MGEGVTYLASAMKPLLTIFILLIYCRVFSQWQILSTVTPLAVDFVNDSTGLVVHNTVDGCFILKTTDYGETWDTVCTYTTSFYFEDVVFASDNIAYACGAPDVILKSVDGGETWFDPTPDQDPYFADIYFVNETIGYGAQGDGFGRLGVTIDGGISWSINEDASGRDIQCLSQCNCFAAIGTRIFQTDNCGSSWPSDTIDFLNRDVNTLWFHNPNYGFLGSLGGFGTYFMFNFGSIRRTYDGGESFDILDFPYTQFIRDIVFTDSLTGYAACSPYDGHPYSILKTMDGGNNWGYQDVDIFPPDDDYPGFSEIDCPSPEICYAVGGGIYRTTNAGGEIHEAWVEVGVRESKQISNAFTLYPNPASAILTVSGIPSGSRFTSSIFNSLGQILHQASNEKEIDVSYLARGVYYIEVVTEKEKGVIRWVKE